VADVVIDNPYTIDMYQHPGHLIRRAQQVHNFLWTTDVSRDVTSTQFAVLCVIAQQPQLDQNSLARQVSVDTSTFCEVVNRLIDRGYVVSGRSVEDRRRNLLTLTERGRSLFAELAVGATELSARLLAGLSPEERSELLRLLQRVVEAGEAARDRGEGKRR
jgi:DNA-binding MarR family transcriptional regulator